MSDMNWLTEEELESITGLVQDVNSIPPNESMVSEVSLVDGNGEHIGIIAPTPDGAYAFYPKGMAFA